MKRGQERDTAKLATSFGLQAEAGTQMLFSEEDFDKSSTLVIYVTVLFFFDP